jgi:hypothetical protein
LFNDVRSHKIDHLLFFVSEILKQEQFNIVHSNKIYSSIKDSKNQAEYVLDLSDNDVIEISAAIYHQNKVRLITGEPVALNHFTQKVSHFFGKNIINIDRKIQKIYNRKKSNTPYLNKLTIALEKFNKQKISSQDL